MSVIKVIVASVYNIEARLLKQILELDPEVQVSALAHNTNELLAAVAKKKPDVILLDVETFGRDPVDVVGRIMAETPIPIILLSTATESTETTFEAISAGAVTAINKPALVDLQMEPELGAELVKHVKTFSKVKVIRHLHGGRKNNEESVGKPIVEDKTRIIGIASSTGGPQALRKILTGFPESIPASIVIAQHITQGFSRGLIEWLDAQSQVRVKEAVDGERIKSGVAYIAPDGYHLTVQLGPRVKLIKGKSDDQYLPSGNKLLASIADIYGARAIGVVLSGMGDDGVKGLLAIYSKGGKTIVQDEDTCVVFGMPKVALEKGAVRCATPLSRIAWEIMKELS